MKRIVMILLSIFSIAPCLANIHITPDAVVSVVQEFVHSDKVNSVIGEYNNQLKQSNGTGISAQALWDVCAIAGWDIKKSDGKSQCEKFVNALVRRSTIKFFHACAKENKGKAGYICVSAYGTDKQPLHIPIRHLKVNALIKKYILAMSEALMRSSSRV